MFGVGLGNFQNDAATNFVDHRILVNGVDLGTVESLANFVSGVNVRNGYLKIEAEAGEFISSVAIEMRQSGRSIPSSADGLIFDHLAFGGSPLSVPEPDNLGLLGVGLLGLALARRKRMA